MTASRSFRVTPGEGGTSEEAWLASPSLRAARPPVLPGRGRVVVLAPHPDDEVLGVGGLLRHLHRCGATIHVCAVTDGEAAPSRAAPGDLAELRTAESARALHRLGLRRLTRERLHLPDGAVAAHQRELVTLVRRQLVGCSLVLSTWSADGHPDHEATGRAARQAAAGRVPVLEFPVWAWYWASPTDGTLPEGRLRRWDLGTTDRLAKRHAVRAFRSQLRPSGGEPVLPGRVLRYHLRSFETLIAPDDPA